MVLISEPEVKKTLDPFGGNAMDRLVSIGSFADNAKDIIQKPEWKPEV